MKILKKLKKLFTKSSKNKTFSELKKSDMIWFETDMGRVIDNTFDILHFYTTWDGDDFYVNIRDHRNDSSMSFMDKTITTYENRSI